jgi:hypothetical protein
MKGICKIASAVTLSKGVSRVLFWLISVSELTIWYYNDGTVQNWILGFELNDLRCLIFSTNSVEFYEPTLSRLYLFGYDASQYV